MKVLQIHNKYRQYGGEDVVVNNEFSILVKNEIEIEQLYFDNEGISATKLFYNKDSYKETLEKIESFKPDIVHVHNIFYNASPSVLKAAKEKHIPVVMTLHNYRLLCAGALFLRNSEVCTKCKDLLIPYHGIVNRCFKNSYSKSAILATFIGINKLNSTWDKYLDRIIVLTPFIKDLFINSSLGIDSSKFIVKANSTDDLGVSNQIRNKSNYLFVGRLSKEKGLDFLVEAFKELPGQTLHVVGEGELAEELKGNSTKNVIFYGKRDKAFIKEMLFSNKALIFSSVWYEGLPNTIIESFSAGTPIFASNIDNVNTIIEDGFNGKLFNLNDLKDFRNKLLEFDQMDISEYEKNARASYEKYYTHEVNSKELLRIYSELILENEKKDY